MRKITIVIPAFRPNENLAQLVHTLADSGASILLVNDGSGPQYEDLFQAIRAIKNVNVLSHRHNQGKGQALKTAFEHILKHNPQTLGVVTADADGQHLAQDIIEVGIHLHQQPTHLILGIRQFQGKVPLRSKFGNTLTRYIFALLMGKQLSDTQTGLRGIPIGLMEQCLSIQSSGYEFELEMLILAVNSHIPIEQCPITTVYEEKNASSHFNPIRDSIKIYLVFFRFATMGVITAAVDFFVFVLSYFLSQNLLLSEGIARASGGLFSFYSGKKWVFKSRHDFASELLKYILLWLTLLCTSYSLLYFTVHLLSMNPYISKITIQLLLFIVSFVLQRSFVFRPFSKQRFKSQLEC